MKEKVKKIILGSLSAFGLLLLIGLGIGGEIYPVPDNAIIFIDNQKHTYIAPPCVGDVESFETVTAKRAHELVYQPDEECRDQGVFIQEGRSFTGMFLEWVGILNPLSSRWNPDGTWNWFGRLIS